MTTKDCPETLDTCTSGTSVDTHSDPDESPSTVPALMVKATPFRPALSRPSLEEDPRGEPGAPPQAWAWAWTRLGQVLSAMGDSCFFFRIPVFTQEATSEQQEVGIFSKPRRRG